MKALAWEQPDETAWLGHGTEMCQYYIRFDDADQTYWMPGESNNEDAEEYRTIEAAKAAAQRQFETLIRSALTHPAPAPGPADAVGEAEVAAALAEWSKPNERREPAAIMRAAIEAAQRARK